MILSGSGFAGLVLPPLITSVVELWGWRAGFLVLGLLPLFITLPLTLYWLKPPALSPSVTNAHNPGPDETTYELPGEDFSTAVVGRKYWTINISMVLVSSAIIVMVINTVPLLRDKGFSALEASQMFGAFGISLVLGRVFVGYLVDRLWAPGVGFVALSLPALGCVLLIMVESSVGLQIVGIGLIGIGAGAEFDLAAFYVARYFGMRDYSRLFGLQMGVISGGICLAPTCAAILYQRTGGYDVVLTVNAVLFTVGAMILLSLGPYPHHEAKIII